MDTSAVIGRIPLLRQLSGEHRRRLADRSIVTNWRAGEALWRRGEAARTFHFIESGRVRLNVVGHARPMALAFLDDGMLACAAAICRHTCYCCDAVVVDDSRILAVPEEALLGEGDQDPPMALILEAVSERTLLMCRRMREAAGARVSQRLCEILLRMADSEGQPGPGPRVRLRAVSREELAALCASTAETVVRILTRLDRDGVVVKEGADLLVDTERLALSARTGD